MILPNVDTCPTYEAMKRGEWPQPNPQVAAAWQRLKNLDFSGDSEESKPDTEATDG